MATTRGQVFHPSCCNRFGLGKGFSVVTKHFRSKQSFVKARSFYVGTKYFCVTIELGIGWGFYVAIEYSSIAIEFGLDRGFKVSIEYFLVAAEFRAKAKRVYVATEFPEIMSRQGIP